MTKPVFLLVCLLLLAGCHQTEQEHAQHALPALLVTQPIRKDIDIIKEYVAQIHAYRHIELRALERGYLQDIYVDEGQFVKKGQKMFKIMPNVYQVDLQKARAEADVAKIEYQNIKALTDQKIMSDKKLALTKAKLDTALAEVRLAQTHLNFTDIKAPFDGLMDHLEKRNGSLLDEGELLTTLSDISKMWVYFNVPEAEYLNYKLHKGKQAKPTVNIRLANNEIYEQDGTIDTIEADFDNKTGNIEFRATFPNPDQLLRHGATGTILMHVPHRHAQIIPQKAVFEILDKSYVYVVDKHGVLTQRQVEIAAEQPYIFVISSGLKDKDNILIEGLRRVKNGQKIDINFQAPDQVLSSLKLDAE